MLRVKRAFYPNPTNQNTNYYYPAKTLIGVQGVQDAMNLQNASSVSLFSNKRLSGYDIDGKEAVPSIPLIKIAGVPQEKAGFA